MKVRKIKRPAGIFTFDFRPVAEDGFGVWLHSPRGSAWEAPHDVGTMPFDVLMLLNPDRWWVALWVDDPGNKRVEIDVCLVPIRESDGWTYVDLELDPVRHEDGTIEILDRDEFDNACRNGWIAESDAQMANAVATAMEAALRNREEPLGNEGWRRLDSLRGASGLRSQILE
jgi:hypothetical protein